MIELSKTEEEKNKQAIIANFMHEKLTHLKIIY